MCDNKKRKSEFSGPLDKFFKRPVVTENRCDSSESDNEVASSASDKKCKTRNYEESWKQKYPWLIRLENGNIACKLCIESKFSNAMTRGTDNFGTSTLVRHARTPDHHKAVVDSTSRNTLKEQVEGIMDKKCESVKLAMSTVYFMAKEDLPLSNYESLIDFQRLQGVQKLQELSMSGNASYDTRKSAEEF